MLSRIVAAVLVGSLAMAGCSADADSDNESELEASQDEVRESLPGPIVKRTDGEVWAVTNAWADTNTTEAKKAGVAWPANSGLSWEQKYRKWIGTFEKVPGRLYGDTIRIKTPQGKVLDGPVLECADVGIWLRMTFSAWYHLPFYMTGYKNGQPFYFGHFGVVDRNGDAMSGFPRFRTQYRDYEGSWTAGSPWPTDPTLRKRHVGSDDGAKGVKIGDRELAEGDGAGAYLDELFLNKRVGYLYIWLDSNFGSANLADGANMFHIKADAVDVGDLLVERFQREGIGHTLPLMTRTALPTGKLRLSVASGSMPRRQPSWEDEAQSARYFKLEATGGAGENWDGTPYAKLGGGIRRWRTPVANGGRWNNIVPLEDRAVYIEDSNLGAIAARPGQYETLLAEDSPEASRDAALATIESARSALKLTPASCSQRTKREDAFKELYRASEQLGKTRSQVDSEYRKLEDYVFSELEYTQSKTCCWNSTNAQMAEIVLDFATKEKDRNDAQGVCRQPTVFRSNGGGKYDTWKTHAAALGRSAQWKEWSEDEPCAQRGVAEDTLGANGNIAMCQAP